MPNPESEEKLIRVRSLMKKNNYDGILLTRNDNFAWITSGKSAFVDRGSIYAASKIFITENKQYVICNSSEMYRIMDEELTDGYFELINYYWHENENEVLKKLFGAKKIASDSGVCQSENICDEIHRLHYTFTKEETERYREIGAEVAFIAESSCMEIKKGESEYKTAARVTSKLTEAGYNIPVCLIASDERLLKYRHPIPKNKSVEKYLMTALCAQKYGLTVSMTRIVCFGNIDNEIKKKYEALLKIESAFILNTIVGSNVGDIVDKAHQCYLENGFEKDFHLHHQGGALGYLTRYYCADKDNKNIVEKNQAFSWNPTIAGTKIEDTYLIFENGAEIISQTGDWPSEKIIIGNKSVKRPQILLR